MTGRKINVGLTLGCICLVIVLDGDVFSHHIRDLTLSLQKGGRYVSADRGTKVGHRGNYCRLCSSSVSYSHALDSYKIMKMLCVGIW